MKLNKKAISIVALAGVIAFAGVNAAEKKNSHSHKEMNGERMVERMTKKLDLTHAQQDSIGAIVTEFTANNPHPDRTVMKAKHLAMKEQFQTLMANPEFDDTAVIQHFEEQASNHRSRKLNRLKLQHAIYQQLTEEQQPKYLKMMAKKMRKMKGKKLKHLKHNGENEEL